MLMIFKYSRDFFCTYCCVKENFNPRKLFFSQFSVKQILKYTKFTKEKKFNKLFIFYQVDG